MGTFSVIYDTNTFISAYGWGRKPETAIKIGFYDRIDVYVSRPILDEYRRVLSYDRLPFSTAEQRTLVGEFRDLTNAIRRDVRISIQRVTDDPDDNRFLELAATADVDYIVTGDSHLEGIEYFESNIESHEGTDICNSTAFLNAIDMEPPESPLRRRE